MAMQFFTTTRLPLNFRGHYSRTPTVLFSLYLLIFLFASHAAKTELPENGTVPAHKADLQGNVTVPAPKTELPGNFTAPAPEADLPGNVTAPAPEAEVPGNGTIPTPNILLPGNVTVPAVMIFGDSIVDQGNNNNGESTAKCNFPPYGKDFMGGRATGRFSNGKTPSDLVAEQLGVKEYLPASEDPNLQSVDLLTGVSFASGGTGFDPMTPQLAGALTMPDQLGLFRDYTAKLRSIFGQERANYTITNAVYFVVAGSDDIANTYFTLSIRRLQYDIPHYAAFVASLASNFTQELYKHGARRIVIVGIPPVGCLPSQRTNAGGLLRDCAENYNEAARILNANLKSQINNLNLKLPQSKVVFVDIYNPLLELIQHPKKYGFDVVDRGCCGTGLVEVTGLCNKITPTCSDDTKFLFWDTYHPTERGYVILVDKMMPDIVKVLE